MKTIAMQRYASQSLQKALDAATTSASSSKNDRLNAARAGLERGGNTAPGSQIPLTTHGLLAGTRDDASDWQQHLPPDLKTLVNVGKKTSRLSRASASEKTIARILARTYSKITYLPPGTYRREDYEPSRILPAAQSSQGSSSQASRGSSSQASRGYSSQAGRGSSSRPTTGALSLTAAAKSKIEKQKEWSSKNNADYYYPGQGSGSSKP